MVSILCALRRLPSCQTKCICGRLTPSNSNDRAIKACLIPNAPEVQTDARRAHQQDPKALALNPMCATSTPLTMQGSRGPERNRRAVQLCGSHLKDPFFPQPSILECTASARKRPGRCNNIKALPSPQRDSPEKLFRGAAVSNKGRASCSGSGTTIKREAAN